MSKELVGINTNLNQDAISVILSLTPEQLTEALLIRQNQNEVVLMKSLDDVNDTLTDFNYKLESKSKSDNHRFNILESKIENRALKQDYTNSDMFLPMRSLGRQMNPAILNNMAPILKWLGIIYYDISTRLNVPYSSAFKNDIARSRPCETKQGYTYQEFTYNVNKVNKLFIKKLREHDLLDEWNSLIQKKERDAWIKDRLK
jgi:hypothetical protein